MSSELLGEYTVSLHADCLLGRGVYGDVYRGVHTESRVPVAVKRIDQQKVSIEFMEQEVAAIRAASGHKNVVSLLHHELQRGFMYLVVELCKEGDLDAYFSHNEVRDVEAGRLLQDCVAAIHHLHTRRPPIAHRDIKPTNYLVTYIDGISRVKACDFGLSRMVPDETLFGLTTACGSPHFMAPEFYRERVHYNTPTDIFALGMLLWAIDHREVRQPLRALTQGLQGLGMAWYLKGASWNPFPQNKSSDTKISVLARRMMSFKPEARPDISYVLRAVQDIVRRIDGEGDEVYVLRWEVEDTRKAVEERDDEIVQLRTDLESKKREVESKGDSTISAKTFFIICTCASLGMFISFAVMSTKNKVEKIMKLQEIFKINLADYVDRHNEHAVRIHDVLIDIGIILKKLCKILVAFETQRC